MSLQYNVNQLPINGPNSIFLLKELLKNQAGWTVVSSADGTTTSAGDIITGFNAGAGGLNNAGAWFVVQMPGLSGRQLCVQRGTVSTRNWWVQYSYSVGFTGGTATVAPTAADSKNIVGSSAAGVIIFNTDGTYNYHLAADNAAPYGFYAIGYPAGGGDLNAIFMLDPMLSASFPAQDVDPYVFFASGYNGGAGNVLEIQAGLPATDSAASRGSLGATAGVPVGYLKKGLVGEGFVVISQNIMGVYNGASFAQTVPSLVGTNPHNGNDDLYPIIYGRANAFTIPIGYKGVSSLMQFLGGLRASGDTLTVSSSKDRIVLNGGYAMPWNGSTPNV